MRPHMVLLSTCLSLPCLSLTCASQAQAGLEESCVRDGDLNVRVYSCSQIIDHSRNRRQQLRAYNTRGLALCDLDRCAEAVQDFEHVLSIDSSIAGYFDNYARALRAAARYDEALRISNRAIVMAPKYAFVYHGKALTLEEMGRYQEALRVTEASLHFDQNNAGSWEYAGKLLGLLKDYSRAYTVLDMAQKIEPMRDHVHLTRADVEIAQGDTDAAYRDLNSIPSTSRNYDEARRKLASIQAPMEDQEQIERAANEAKEQADRAEAQAKRQREMNEARQREIAAQKEKRDAEDEATRLAAIETAAREARDQQIADQRRRVDAERKAEAEPINVLTRAYASYIVVKRCHERRDGYATSWINDGELERGRREIKTVETKQKSGGALDTNAAWVAANERADRILSIDDHTCHGALADLDSAFRKADPEAAMTKKDF